MSNAPPRASRFLASPLDAPLIWVAVLLFTLEAAVSTRALNRAAKAEAPAAVTAIAAASADQSTVVTAGLAALTDASATAVAPPEPAPGVAQAASLYRVVVPLPPLR